MWSSISSWGRDRRLALGLGLLCVLVAVFCLFQAAAHTTALSRVEHSRAGLAGGRLTPASTLALAPDAPQLFEQLTPEQAVAINAQTPFSTAPNPPAAPFKLVDAVGADRAQAVTCLTMAIYYEAATQGADGEAAVAQVVLNRVRNPHFPQSVCGVVFEGSTLATGCQFTFTCDGSFSRTPAPALWRGAGQVAERALSGYVEKTVGMSTHYHTIWVVPYWRPSVTKVAQIGAHIFYRLDGGMGAPAAFTARYAGGEIIPATVRALDLDTTPQLASAAAIDAAAQSPPPEPAIAAVAAAPAQATPQPRPIEVAMQTDQDPAAAAAAPPAAPVKTSFFGHGSSSGQRLPMARW
jgi:spore germination cell wall hydrolase CwlJ-like protein